MLEPIDLENGTRTLVEYCGLIPVPPREWLIATGADRARFVNGLVTCDVRELQPGSGCYGFFTDPKGRILADVAVRDRGEDWLLDVPSGRGASLLAHMLKYRVADRVEVVPAESLAELAVAGSGARGVLTEVLEEPPSEGLWGHERVGDLEILNDGWIGLPSFRLRGPASSVASLRSDLGSVGIVDVATEAIDVVRAERGRPLFGVDFDDDCFPQETGIEDEAISYSKGCYLGQEVIARIHYRGHVNRHLRGLRAGSGDRIEVGESVHLGTEEVGVVSTAGFSVSVDASIGLAILHRKAEPRATLRLDSDLGVTVVELPFV